MKKLCFGSLMTVLKLCKAKSITQKMLCGTALLSVAPQYDIRNEDGTVSDLLLCKKELSSNVTSIASTVDAKQIAAYFKKHLLPMLDVNKRSVAILALKNIITFDDSIKADSIIDRVSGMTKSTMLEESSFVFEDLLVGLFLYTATVVNNRDGKPYIKEINSSYIDAFDSQSSEITITEKSILPRHSFLVGLQDQLFSAQGTNKHQKS